MRIAHPLSKIQQLIVLLKEEKEQIFIQTHNFPDHDAVAAAWALQILLSHFGIQSSLIFDGNIERNSLKRMIRAFDISIHHYTHYNLKDSNKIIIVDGCKGNKNVTDLAGQEVAVIDHHPVIASDDVTISDIRIRFGSCATIIYTYYQELDIPISQELASVLMIAIYTDTAGMTRHTSHTDITAYAELNKQANVSLVNSILRNYHRREDLPYYSYAIKNVKISNKMAFCHFTLGCPQNLLGILGDFFLSLEEVEFVVLSTHNKDRINLSVRSENPNWHCGLILSEVLQGIGFGGGHAEMAGGIISNPSDYSPEAAHKQFLELLEFLLENPAEFLFS